MTSCYISVDIEAAGPVPSLFSMLSLGACVVGNRQEQFYRELKPVSRTFNIDAMRVGSLGLHCLDSLKSVAEYDPHHEQFSPGRVLDVLAATGKDPQLAMADFRDWLSDAAGGKSPVMVTDVQPFDGSFVNWYFARFLPDVQNPFGHKGLNIDVLYHGLCGDVNARLKKLVPDDRKTPHNALDDALYQARLTEEVFSYMRRT